MDNSEAKETYSRIGLIGTICDLVSSELGFVTFSTGALLRAEVAAGTSIGKTTLETSGEDVKLHSFRVEKM